MPQFSDPLLLGTAPIPGSLGGIGAGPLGNIYMFDMVPLTLQADGLGLSQTLLAGANFVLTAGTGVTQKTRFDGQVIYEMDVARCVTFTSTANYAGVLLTIFGYDTYGQQMSVGLSGLNNNTVTSTKAFKSIYQAKTSGNMSTAVTFGFGDKFGLPFRVTDAGYIASVKWNNTLADDAGTFVAADQTDPSTPLTTDVRGCYTPSSASDGVKRLVMGIYLPALASGPSATRIGALGVKQNLQTS